MTTQKKAENPRKLEKNNSCAFDAIIQVLARMVAQQAIAELRQKKK